MQLSKLESVESEQGNTTELLKHITDCITKDKATIITGDFNICYHATKNNKITKYLEANGFIQLMTEATHIKGRHIDHFYFKSDEKILKNPLIYRYSPYYSDHDAICATLSLEE